jgi:hypothetical protein
MFNINNKVFLFGGYTPIGNRNLADLWEYDLNVTQIEDANSLATNDAHWYPNPSNGFFYTTVNKPALLNIYDLSGKLVFEERVLPKSSIDLSHLNSSILIYQMIGEDFHYSGKLLIGE